MKQRTNQVDFLAFLAGLLLVFSLLVFTPVPEAGKIVLAAVVISVIYVVFAFRLKVRFEIPRRGEPQDTLEPDAPAQPAPEPLPVAETVTVLPAALHPEAGDAELAYFESPVEELDLDFDPGELSRRLAEFKTRINESIVHSNLALAEFKVGSDFIFENVGRTFDISDNLANTAKQAFEMSEKVQSGVGIVTGALTESLKNTGLLFEQSKKISMILDLMSDISEKIHVLSINASIVSARAGQQGKAFEVVAKEIRNLAKETENSLADIENTITELQGTIGGVISRVKTAHDETELEKNALMSVAGALQGVILAVEIIRAVSSLAKEKSQEQSVNLSRIIEQEKSVLDQSLGEIDSLRQALESNKKE